MPSIAGGEILECLRPNHNCCPLAPVQSGPTAFSRAPLAPTTFQDHEEWVLHRSSCRAVQPARRPPVVGEPWPFRPKITSKRVVRSSASAYAIYPPFLGVIRVRYPKAWYRMSNPS